MQGKKLLSLGVVAGLLVSLLSLASCAPAGGTGEQQGTSTIYTIVFLAAIFAVFYFLIIRPQRKRQKEHQKVVESLKRGDKVITAGGIYGVIESLSEDSVIIKVESGTTLRVVRNSVALRREK